MNKLTAEHQTRRVSVYVSQSTLDQVRHNLESQRPQHAPVDRARALRQYDVDLIDDDCGIWDPELVTPSRHTIPAGRTGTAPPSTGAVDAGVTEEDPEGGRP